VTLTRKIGFAISAVIFYSLNRLFPVNDMEQIDPVDLYGTFTTTEARRVGVAPLQDTTSIERRSSDNAVVIEEGKRL
jgi:NCS1 family nucleobase:cation symporter-1